MSLNLATKRGTIEALFKEYFSDLKPELVDVFDKEGYNYRIHLALETKISYNDMDKLPHEMALSLMEDIQEKLKKTAPFRFVEQKMEAQTKEIETLNERIKELEKYETYYNMHKDLK